MCPYGIAIKKIETKKAGSCWMVRTEHPEQFPFLRRGRAPLLEDSGRHELKGRRVLYCDVRLDGPHFIAKKWKLADEGPTGRPRSAEFANSDWVAESIKLALAGVQVPENAALVLYDPLFFGRPVMHGTHRVPLDFLALARSGQLAEDAVALLSLMESVLRVRPLATLHASDELLQEARRRMHEIGNPPLVLLQNGLFTACYKTTFNPAKHFAPHIKSSNDTWGLRFVPVEGIVIVRKQGWWSFIEAEVIAKCVERLSGQEVR